jgi:hypothetical protein
MTDSNIWYRFTAPYTGCAIISLCESGYDAVLAVYETSSCYPAATDLIGCDDNSCGRWGLQPEVNFLATAGTEYLIEIGSSGNSVGQGTLTVRCSENPCPPPNDHCWLAEPVGNVALLPFDTRYARFDGSALCMNSPNIWYCYTATNTGNTTVSLCGSNFDTMLAVYDTCECFPEADDLIDCNDDHCGPQSQITFPAVAGNQYLIEVGGYGEATGQGKLTIISNDDCDSAQPIGDVEDLPFNTAVATFDGPGLCMTSPNIWYCYTASCTGAATVSLCGSGYDTMLAVYDNCQCYPQAHNLIDCNDDHCGHQSEVTFAAIAGEQYLIEVGGYGPAAGQGKLTTSCEGEPGGLSNDDCDKAKPVGDTEGLLFDTTDATFDGPGLCMISPNIWYCYTATCTGEATVSLCGSAYDTMLAVYDGCQCYPSEKDVIGCNDDCCGWQSKITFSAVAGNQYLIEVGGYSSETGQGVLAISCAPAPADLDFGDAPEPYPTVLAAEGARHTIVPDFCLGTSVDGESDGQPNATATGDDDAAADDEDGVKFVTALIPGETAAITVTNCIGMENAGFLDAWIDFNGDGSWDQAGDQIVFSRALSASGFDTIFFDVPDTAMPDITTFARFRLSSTGYLPFDGPAQDGEVEDYAVQIRAPKTLPIKWVQHPDLSPRGLDINATSQESPTAVQRILADDFKCNSTEDLLDIHLWGSWLRDLMPGGDPTAVAFTLSIHSNIPAGASSTGYSMPGEVLWTRQYEPGEFEVRAPARELTEGWYDPIADEFMRVGDYRAWQYTFYLEPDEFEQQGTPTDPMVYWLAVEAKPTDPNARFGWKTSVTHWQDAAVSKTQDCWDKMNYPSQHPRHPKAIDLAFMISGEKQMPKSDLGDAPDSTNNAKTAMTAYPKGGPLGVKANYPTVFTAPGGGPRGPKHLRPLALAYLGENVTGETEADTAPDQDGVNNIEPATDTPDQDGADDGVIFPLNLPHCRWATFDYLVNVVKPSPVLYVNVWLDWNRDGDWDDVIACSNTRKAREWAVRNQVLAGLPAGTHQITTDAFTCWHPSDGPEQIWMRITLSARPWTGGYGPGKLGNGGSGPKAGYAIGETEDYYFVPDTSVSICRDLNGDGVINLTDLVIIMNDWLQNCP